MAAFHPQRDVRARGDRAAPASGRLGWTSAHRGRAGAGPRELLSASEVVAAVTFDYATSVRSGSAAGRRCFDDPMLLVLPLGHRLAGSLSSTSAAVADQRWIAGLPSLPSTSRHGGGLARIPARYSAQHRRYVVTQTLVSAGLGVALLPSLAVEAARGHECGHRACAGPRATTRRLVAPADLPASPATNAAIQAIHRGDRVTCAPTSCRVIVYSVA